MDHSQTRFHSEHCAAWREFLISIDLEKLLTLDDPPGLGQGFGGRRSRQQKLPPSQKLPPEREYTFNSQQQFEVFIDNFLRGTPQALEKLDQKNARGGRGSF